MSDNSNKDMFWQQIRGGTILAVILIHYYAGIDFPLNSVNGFSYFITRNLVNFPVDMFFFMSGFFMRPVDDVTYFYKIPTCTQLVKRPVKSTELIFVPKQFGIFENQIYAFFDSSEI